jgi:predicted permease
LTRERQRQNQNQGQKMLNTFITLSALILLGKICAWLKPAGMNPITARDVINNIVIYFSVPALCFKVISGTALDVNILLAPLSAIIIILTTLLLSFCFYTLTAKFFKISNADKGVLIVVSSFGNLVTFGLPVLTSLYGQETIRHILVFDLMGQNPLLWIVGSTILAYYSFGGKITLKQGLKNLISLPPIWALAAGFIVNLLNLTVPETILVICDMMATPLVPIMLFAVGLSLSIPKAKLAIAIPALSIKLIVMPLIAFGIVSLLGIADPIALKSIVLESAMPVMASAMAIVSIYKLDQSLAAFIMVLSIIFSFITIPVIALLLTNI